MQNWTKTKTETKQKNNCHPVKQAKFAFLNVFLCTVSYSFSLNLNILQEGAFQIISFFSPTPFKNGWNLGSRWI